MTAFNQCVLETLHRRGALEVRFLVRTVQRLTPSKKSELELIEDLLGKALNGEAGFLIAEYPKYRLRVSPDAVKLPTGKYARAALLALTEAKAPLSLSDLVHRYSAMYRHAAISPEFWMWHILGRKEWSRVISRTGALSLDLTQTVRDELDGRSSSKKAHSLEPSGSIAERLDEKSLETILANRPDLLEPGLTLFQRQSRLPVGIVDLLCLDRQRNYVVVEIKRPAADYREVVGQITTYMGWVRKNVAKKGQTVRGIIVVGRQNERLEYSLDMLPDISVKTFF